MTIKMRLDTEGLRSLIASNPDLEIEIGNEVINNIKDSLIKTNMELKVSQYFDSMVKREEGYHNPVYKLNPLLSEAVGKALNQEVIRLAKIVIDSEVKYLVSKELSSYRDELRLDVKRELSNLLTADMAKELLLAKLSL